MAPSGASVGLQISCRALPVLWQRFDLPGPQPLEMTEHRAHPRARPSCAQQTRARPSGGGERSGAVRSARDRHGGLPAERPVPAGGAPGGHDAGSVRRATVRGDAGEHGGQRGAVVTAIQRQRARAAHGCAGRDRISHPGQGAVAGCDRDAADEDPIGISGRSEQSATSTSATSCPIVLAANLSATRPKFRAVLPLDLALTR